VTNGSLELSRIGEEGEGGATNFLVTFESSLFLEIRDYAHLNLSIATVNIPKYLSATVLQRQNCGQILIESIKDFIGGAENAKAVKFNTVTIGE
jgi:hypothetical protein